MAKKKKKGYVPEILWRLFQTRARTLSDTIISLIPQTSKCNCKENNNRQCLGCILGKDDVMSYLVKPKDPREYRCLLFKCFVVVSNNAPALGEFCPHRRWPQIELVRRSIEMLCEQRASSNLLCSGYDKGNRSSSVVELLTGPAWNLLLKRVGDGLMIYLLKYTSIFLHHFLSKYQQVAGHPITDLCYNRFPKRKRGTTYERESPFQQGSIKKRKNPDGVSSLSERETTSSSFPGCTDNDGQKSNEKTLKPKKRIKLSSWQRRKRKKSEAISIIDACTSASTDSKSLSLTL